MSRRIVRPASFIERDTPRFSVSFAPTSFAEQTFGQVAARLESAHDSAVAMFGVDDGAPARIRVRLRDASDPVGADSEVGPEIDEEYHADSPGPGLEKAVLRTVVRRDVGRAAPLPPFIEDGLVANLLRRMGPIATISQPSAGPSGPSAPQVPNGVPHAPDGAVAPVGGVQPPRPMAPGPTGPGPMGPGPSGAPGGRRPAAPQNPDDAALIEAKRQHALPPIAAFVQGTARASGVLQHAAASSFVRFLQDGYAARQLKTFVAALDAHDPDSAARTAFGKNLRELDSRWRKTLGAVTAAGVLRLLGHLVPFFRGRGLQIAEIVLELLATVGYGTLVVTVQQPLIDDINNRDLDGVRDIILKLLVLFVVSALLSLRQGYATARLTQDVLTNLRLRIFALLQHLDAQFFADRQSGDILSRTSMDVNSVEQLVALTVPQIVGGVIQLVLALGVLLGGYPRFGVFLILAIPLMVMVGRYFGPRAALASRARQQDMSVLMSTLQEDLAAQSVVKAFGLQRLLTERYQRELHQFARSAVRMSFVSGLTSFSNQTVTTAVQLAILGFGAWAAVSAAAGTGQVGLAGFLNGDRPLTGGAVVATLGLTMQVVGAVRQLSGMTQMLQQATGPMERVDELLRTEPAIKDAPNAARAEPLAREIRLENVWFGYTRTQAVLRGLDLAIPAGSSVAIVGPSGCGKSTLLGLVQRAYDPNAGSVRFDGQDLRQLTLDSIRGQQGIVFQESILFDLSIRENIRFGKPGATDAEVEEAARSAEIHDVIVAMPDGYDTRVGERGSRLSGGQRQRVAIARAILRNPSILLLDEATSALDPASEAAINQTLHLLAANRTTISVTHRLNSITRVDQIYVLERGAVVEHGTHDELLARHGLYSRLWHEQMDVALQDTSLSRAADVERLRAVPLLAKLDATQLAKLAGLLRAERFNTGDDVVRQGDAGDKLYVIEQGQADIIMADPGGVERHLAVLNPNEYFGEVALLHDVPRTATVRARTPLLVNSLSKPDFLRALSTMPELRSAMEQRIAQRRPGAPPPIPRAPAERQAR